MPALLDASTAPRSTISLSQAQDRVRGDLGLRDSSLITDQDLIYWFNEASDLISMVCNQWYRISHTMGTTDGTKEYALPTPASGRCLQIQEVRYDNQLLCYVTEQQLRQLFPDYPQDGEGTPIYYYVKGSSGFGLHPTPDTTDIDILTVLYAGKPPHVSADDDYFYCPHGTEYAIILYAKWLASEKDKYGEGRNRAIDYERRWKEALEQIKQQVSETAENGTWAMGEEMYYEDRGWDPHMPWRTSIS